MVELAIPFDAVGAGAGDRLLVSVAAELDGLEVERWPRFVPLGFQRPTDDFEADMWHL